jgi:hypothetical protein
MIPYGYEQEPGRERTAPYYREQERRMREEHRSRDPMSEDMYNRRGGNYARGNRAYGTSRSNYSRSSRGNRMESRMGTIGFAYDTYDMRGGRRGGASMHGGGGSHGSYEMGHDGEDYGLTYEEAEEWVRSMKNADGSHGGKWEMEELEKVLRERGIKCDILTIYAGMNALYSDLGEVMKSFGIKDSNVDFWLELCKAFWLEDEDAVEDKLAVYYDCIVE